jgi:sulfoxide reductase heme-binding subunit YedZ
MMKKRISWQPIVHIASLLPLALLLWDLAWGRLSFNPIREATLRTGRYALALLVLSLACTPLRVLLRMAWIGRLRKPLGLYAALYAVLHFAIFVAWDYGFQLDLIWLEIRDRPFIWAGLPALLILVLLAVTSTRGWMRRLGRNWKRLHRMVYLAAPLAVLHFVLIVKVERAAPLIYAAVVVILLFVRVPFVRRIIIAIRSKLTST